MKIVLVSWLHVGCVGLDCILQGKWWQIVVNQTTNEIVSRHTSLMRKNCNALLLQLQYNKLGMMHRINLISKMHME